MNNPPTPTGAAGELASGATIDGVGDRFDGGVALAVSVDQSDRVKAGTTRTGHRAWRTTPMATLPSA